MISKDGSIDTWPYKGTVTRSYDGNDGHFVTIRGRRVKVQKKRKAHLRAQQPPGLPRGTCLGPKDKDKSCRCGTHNEANRDYRDWQRARKEFGLT